MNKFIKTSAILLGIILLIVFLYYIAPLVKIIIIAALFAYLLNPVASLLESRGIKRTLATTIVFLSTVLILTGIMFLIVPAVIQEVKYLQKAVSSGEAQVFFNKVEQMIRSQLGTLGIQNFDLTEKLASLVNSFGEQFLGYVFNILTLITNLVIIPFIMFFLLKDGRTIIKKIISYVPNKYFESSLNLVYKMDLQLGNYLRGQFLDAMIIGVLSSLALFIIGVNNFLVIGAFAGLANLIPYIGPVAGAIPAIIVSIMQLGDLSLVPWIILAFALVQLADNVLVQPLVVAKTVNLHPLIVLLVVIIGGKFFGILGMLLAVPFTGVVKVISEEGRKTFRRSQLTT